MQKRVYCLVLLALVFIAAAPRGAQVPSETTAVAQELDSAWNARDAARFSAVFTEDGSFAFPVEGIWLRGRDEIRRHYLKEFPTFAADLRHVITLRGSDVITPGLRATDADVEILGTDPKTGSPGATLARYRSFSLSVRTESGWRIRLARVYPVSSDRPPS